MPRSASTRRRSGDLRAREEAARVKQRVSWEQMKAAVAAKYERSMA